MDDSRTVFMAVMITAFFLAMAAEFLAGRIQRSHRPKQDLLFNLAAFFTQPILTGVVVASIGGFIMRELFPTRAGALADVSPLLAFAIVFPLNELAHYWVHRLAHEWRWLWKLHRTHHSGMDMNATLIYRYNLLWPMIVPQTWIGAAAFYLGQMEAFLAAAMITYLVNVGTHLSFRWDLALRERYPRSEPLWRIVERIITLPDAHQAHHAWGSEQAHPNGNYAVTLFFYDILFGTAKLPVRRQEKFGLPISPRLPWAEELLWPFVRRPLLPRTDR
ncbi:MAG: sterol desaturase family protein [Halioglobus sp.]|nr:sterol desaturase family protein [Halioglobus sp.]